MNLTIKDVTRAIDGQLILGDPKTAVNVAAVDSRRIAPGCLFFALKAERVDGHDFAASAWRQGAAGLVVTRLDWMTKEPDVQCAVIRVADAGEALKALGGHLRDTFKGPVVGITGSNGKTTTKQMVTGVLRRTGQGLSTAGNYNSQIGLPIVLSQLKDEDRWMVLEMGASAPGNIAALCRVARPKIGVITSIGPAHLATFGSLERIAESKWELMESLPPDGCAIVPWGVPPLEPVIRTHKNRIVFFGEDLACPVRASQVEAGEKVRFRLHIGADSAMVQLPVPGRVNVSNALAAAAVGWVLGVPFAEITAGLESFDPPAMRMQPQKHKSGAVLLNDAYNANPASMLQAVQALTETYPRHHRVLVLGSMLELGDDSGRYHFHVGTEVGRLPVDQVYLYGDEAKGIAEGASSVGAAGHVEWMPTHEDIAAALRPRLSPDTVVLFKGSRGMQLERIIEALGG